MEAQPGVSRNQLRHCHLEEPRQRDLFCFVPFVLFWWGNGGKCVMHRDRLGCGYQEGEGRGV
jgi:hypothetical protein